MFGLLNPNDLTKKVMFYLIKKCKKVDRRKLMKLMFLIEYYDPEKNKVTLKRTLDNEFIIYNHGLFSFDVYDLFLDMLERGEIEEKDHEIKLSEKGKEIKIELTDDLKRKIDKIIKKFGDLSSKDLEKVTLKLINLKEENKREFFGIPVDVLISKML